MWTGPLEIECRLYLFQSVVRDFFCSCCSWLPWNTINDKGKKDLRSIQFLEEKVFNFEARKQNERSVSGICSYCLKYTAGFLGGVALFNCLIGWLIDDKQYTSIEQKISLLNLTNDFLSKWLSSVRTKASLFHFGKVKYHDSKIDTSGNWDSCKSEIICPFTELSFKKSL